MHLKRKPVAADVDEAALREIAFETQRYTGAQLANLVNLAAINGSRAGREALTVADLNEVSTPPLGHSSVSSQSSSLSMR